MCIQEYAAALRALDMSPERTLIMVKRLLEDAMDRTGTTSRETMQMVVAWTIEAYYSSLDQRQTSSRGGSTRSTVAHRWRQTGDE